LTIFLAATIAEETKEAEITDQELEATRLRRFRGRCLAYGRGYRFGRSVTDDTEETETHNVGYYEHGNGHRYGRSVADNTMRQKVHYSGYHGHGYGHRYGRSVADDTEGLESYYGGFFPVYEYHYSFCG